MAFGHGKVILLGEHSVVHGRFALALAVERGAEVTATRLVGGERTPLHIEPWGVDVDDRTEPEDERKRLLQKALCVACGFYQDNLPVALSAAMRLPGGAGMGSSAALGVAVQRALDHVRGLTAPDDEIYRRSLAWERVFHGTPSGIDSAMATYGGLLLFKKSPIEGEMPQMAPVVPRKPVKLVVADSGERPPASQMISSVARMREAEPERIGKLFDAIESIVLNGKVALEQGDLTGLGQLMTMNHKLLSSLMLSTDTLEEMNACAMAAGALGAKVTGAGGGGCMIALVDNDDTQRAVTSALRELRKTVYDVRSDA